MDRSKSGIWPVAVILVLVVLTISGTGLLLHEKRMLREGASSREESPRTRPAKPARESTGFENEEARKRAVLAAAGSPRSVESLKRIWEEGSYEHRLVKDSLEPFDGKKLRELADDPQRDPREFSTLVLRAASECDASFKDLLQRPDLRENNGVAIALDAYDYAVNNNGEALDRILEGQISRAKENRGGDTNELWALSRINEWDKIPAIFQEYPWEGDGAGGDAQYAFWLRRMYLYPGNKRFPSDIERFNAQIYPVREKE